MNALIFDVDGTMADTEELHRQAFNAAFERAGLDWHWTRPLYRELLQVAGGKERIGDWIDRLDPGPGQRIRWREQIPYLHADKTRLYGERVRAGQVALRSGVARLLNEAKAAGWHVAIASTTTAANVDALLHATLGPRALDLFSVIACGDVVRSKKPAPDIYELALRTLGIGPDDAVAIEDSAHGLGAATAAGIRTVVTPTYWTEGADFSAAALVLPHLGDPGHEIDAEPGGRLVRRAWLTMDELIALRAGPPPLDAVLALYQGA
jgi:HAD superfamily hydrolase (TIGR01509 family)